MIRIFKRRRPEPAPTIEISIPDLLVARWFGLTKEDWAALPAIAKVDRREDYAHAWGLGA